MTDKSVKTTTYMYMYMYSVCLETHMYYEDPKKVLHDKIRPENGKSSQHAQGLPSFAGHSKY